MAEVMQLATAYKIVFLFLNWVIILSPIILELDTYISSAALHYLSSVGKKTADLQNASTNTDTGKTLARNYCDCFLKALKMKW